MDKTYALKEVYNKYSQKYLKSGPFVLGSGNVNSKLMLIGEAPGKDEIAQDQPFVGAAGKNLNEFLTEIALKRDNI